MYLSINVGIYLFTHQSVTRLTYPTFVGWTHTLYAWDKWMLFSLTDSSSDSILSSTGSALLYSFWHSLWWRMYNNVASLSSLKMVWLKTSRVSKTKAASVCMRESEAMFIGLLTTSVPLNRQCHWCTTQVIELTQLWNDVVCLFVVFSIYYIFSVTVINLSDGRIYRHTNLSSQTVKAIYMIMIPRC